MHLSNSTPVNVISYMPPLGRNNKKKEVYFITLLVKAGIMQYMCNVKI